MFTVVFFFYFILFCCIHFEKKRKLFWIALRSTRVVGSYFLYSPSHSQEVLQTSPCNINMYRINHFLC